MNDSRFQSVHLSGTRRNDFRRARDRVVHARGTVAYDLDRDAEHSSQIDQTAVHPELIKNVQADFMLILGSELVFSLHAGINSIGRFRDNDIVLTPHHISRRHCSIVIHSQGKCELFDLASRNGTYCNNKRIDKSVILSAGDHIRLCDQHFVFYARSEKLGDTLSAP